jgi:hypothetical protein
VLANVCVLIFCTTIGWFVCAQIFSYTRITPTFCLGVGWFGCGGRPWAKSVVNLYTYNQVQTGHLHGCHSTEEHDITIELSQEVWCVDVVMCIYTWVHRTHACTNFASKFVSTNLASKSVCTIFTSKFVYSFFTLPWTGSSVHKYSRIHGSPPLFVWGWGWFGCGGRQWAKSVVNLCTYNQVQTGHLHRCHPTEEHVITMELSQEVWCVDVVTNVREGNICVRERVRVKE